MSVAGVSRKYGIDGPASFLPSASARRRVEPADIAYARQCRAKGWGWQTIGRLTGLNAEDLRKACDPPKPAAPTADGAKASRPMWLSALAAIEAGAAGPTALMSALTLNEPTVHSLLRRLKARGLLAGNARDAGWTITAAGRAQLARTDVRK